ncbi:hypothetical protein Q7P37_009986 [Cladosporium fusiforme]
MTEASTPTPITYEQVERRLKVQDELRYKCWRWQLPPLLKRASCDEFRIVTNRLERHACRDHLYNTIYDLWVVVLREHIASAQMPPPDNGKKVQRHEMLPLRLHQQRHWEMAQDRLKRELQAALPNLFAGGDLPLDSLKHTLELSRHLFAIMLVLPSSLWLERIHFWRRDLFWYLWEDEVNSIIVDQKNFEWGGFWADAHIE